MRKYTAFFKDGDGVVTKDESGTWVWGKGSGPVCHACKDKS